MRGEDGRSGSLFSYVDLEARVPKRHPLRAIGEIVNPALAELSGAFEALYSHTGRPGIAPEKLLRALLLQAFYSIRSERRLMQELKFNLLYRWFVGLGNNAICCRAKTAWSRSTGCSRTSPAAPTVSAAWSLPRIRPSHDVAIVPGMHAEAVILTSQEPCSTTCSGRSNAPSSVGGIVSSVCISKPPHIMVSLDAGPPPETPVNLKVAGDLI